MKSMRHAMHALWAIQRSNPSEIVADALVAYIRFWFKATETGCDSVPMTCGDLYMAGRKPNRTTLRNLAAALERAGLIMHKPSAVFSRPDFWSVPTSGVRS